GAWVLREACRQARAWQRAIRSSRDLRISVNTSARELVEGSFVDGVQAALAGSGLAAASLTLEITESMMPADETAAIASLLRRLLALQCDLGQGYHFAPPLAKDEMTALLAEHHQYRLPEGVFPKRRQTSAA